MRLVHLIAICAALLGACSVVTDFSADCDRDADCPGGRCEVGFCVFTEHDLGVAEAGSASDANSSDTDQPSDECELYCDRIEDACSMVFDSRPACLSACVEYPSEPGDIIADGPRAFDDNTVQCRSYHAMNALADPITHCPHASPDGGGICEDFKGACGEYCGTVVEACADHDGAFADVNACENECNLWPEGFAGDETSDTRQCRLTYARRAADDPTQCDRALADSAACR